MSWEMTMSQRLAAPVALAVMFVEFRPNTLPKKKLTGLPVADVKLTVTCMALALAVPLPETAPNVPALEFQMPSTTSELFKVTAWALATFSAAQALALAMALRGAAGQRHRAGHGRRVGGGLRLGLHDAEVADIDGEGDHADHGHHQDGRKHRDGAAAGTGISSSCVHWMPTFVLGILGGREVNRKTRLGDSARTAPPAVTRVP